MRYLLIGGGCPDRPTDLYPLVVLRTELAAEPCGIGFSWECDLALANLLLEASQSAPHFLHR